MTDREQPLVDKLLRQPTQVGACLGVLGGAVLVVGSVVTGGAPALLLASTAGTVFTAATMVMGAGTGQMLTEPARQLADRLRQRREAAELQASNSWTGPDLAFGR